MLMGSTASHTVSMQIAAATHAAMRRTRRLHRRTGIVAGNRFARAVNAGLAFRVRQPAAQQVGVQAAAQGHCRNRYPALAVRGNCIGLELRTVAATTVGLGVGSVHVSAEKVERTRGPCRLNGVSR